MCAHDYASIKRRPAIIASPFLQFIQNLLVGTVKPARGGGQPVEDEQQSAGGQKQEMKEKCY
jgi:hypothetical protein